MNMVKVYLGGERGSMLTTEAIEKRAGKHAASLWVDSVKRRCFSAFFHARFGDARRFKNGKQFSAAIKDAHRRGWDIMLDSGAFSFSRNKKAIPPSLGEYAEFCHATEHFGWSLIAPLDVMGRGKEFARKTREAWQRLRQFDVDAKPVFHVFEPDWYLEDYVQRRDEYGSYLLIGGMVRRPTEQLIERLDYLWKNFLANKDGRPKLRIHGFGLTSTRLLAKYPWYSVDSTSWLVSGRHGACLFRVNRGPEPTQEVFFTEESLALAKGKGYPHYLSLTKRQQTIIDDRLRRQYGLTAEQVASHYAFRDVVNARTFQGLEDLSPDRFVSSRS